MAHSKARINGERPSSYVPTLGDEFSLTAIILKVCTSFNFKLEYVLDLPISVLGAFHEQAQHREMLELYHLAFFQPTMIPFPMM